MCLDCFGVRYKRMIGLMIVPAQRPENKAFLKIVAGFQTTRSSKEASGRAQEQAVGKSNRSEPSWLIHNNSSHCRKITHLTRHFPLNVSLPDTGILSGYLINCELCNLLNISMQALKMFVYDYCAKTYCSNSCDEQIYVGPTRSRRDWACSMNFERAVLIHKYEVKSKKEL